MNTRRRSSFYLLLMIGCLIGAAYAPRVARAADPSDWPRWRGPKGDGVSNDTKWTNDWPADGPKKLWAAKIGVGFSSMAIADGRVYAMGHKRPKKHDKKDDGDAKDGGDSAKDDEKKAEAEEDYVWCFDVATGKEIWHYSYPCKLVDNLHEGGPAATPTVDGQHVYTLSKEGHLFCFDAAKGDVVWKAELKELFEVRTPGWGFSGSPQVFGDKLILDAGPTVALNKNTGEVIWKTEKFSVGYGSPTFFTFGGEPLAAVLNNDDLMVVRIKDGEIIDKSKWSTPFSTSAATPIVEPTDNGVAIFISTGYGTGCGLYDFADGKLTQRYKNKNMRCHMATCVQSEKGDVLFGIDGQSSPSGQCKLVALNRDSGETLWKHKGLGCGTLIRAGDRLVILSDDGRLVIAAASGDDYKELASAQVLEGKCWTAPALAAGRIYCRNAAGDLVCLDVRK